MSHPIEDKVMVKFCYLQQAELQEDMEARGERMGGMQAHKRMVASLEKQIAVQEKKLEQVRLPGK